MNEKFIEAKKLADKIDNDILERFEKGDNFKVEAGAGSGKTYSLMKILTWIKENNYLSYLKKGQRIACITYTNAAVNVIKERLGEDTFIIPCTIHSFSWEIIKKYQKELIKYILDNNMVPKDFDRELNVVEKVSYELGVKYYENGTLYLYHNDVIELFSYMLDYKKFRIMLASQYPVIFIDEYQDSNKIIINKLIKYFIDEKSMPKIQFGFFGDSWQTIYKTNNAIGNITNSNIYDIKKVVNFRSCPEIIKCLNNIRPALKQESVIEDGFGLVKVIHNNDYTGLRRDDKNFKGDLPIEEIRDRLNKIISTLDNEESTKILMLTHNILASQQEYSTIYQKFGSNFKDNDDKLISFISNMLYPIINSLTNNDTKRLYETLGTTRPPIISQKYKEKWKNLHKEIRDNRDGTVLDLLKIIYNSKLVPMPDDIITIYNTMINNPQEKYNDKATYEEISHIKFTEFERVAEFMKPTSIFSTDHGVKGEEYDNVIFVIGKGWNLYDFEKTLPLEGSNRIQNIEAYERNRNLFYVGCSRPRKKLILLITCELKNEFYTYLSNIFGNDNIVSFVNYIDTLV